ncbi:outer membrane protein assembly factor BamC [Caldimonas brevitalea]|nr:outer membrane protein assembly factor BamC [Caldimonas brevitalea]
MRLAVALAVGALAGCSSVNSVLEGDKVDYRTSGSKSAKLEVPPDLSQLSNDPRYQMPAPSVSATEYQASVPTTTATTAQPGGPVAPAAVGDLRIERAGNQRWLVVSNQAPEQLWPQLKAFWQEAGFNLTTDSPQTGVLETDWGENRAKLPQDIIRRTLGKVLDSVYSTGELDRFRTRVERSGNGSEIYISHRGMVEVYANQQQDQTRWQPREADVELEAQMLSRLMVKLGVKPEQAQAQVASTPPAPARARLVTGPTGQAVQLDDGFDRAWRRVGLSLDRSGFTVEDRDRAQGLYFVRFVAASADKDRREPGLLSRWFGGDSKDQSPARYRVAVKGENEQRSVVSVLDAQGAPAAGATGERILKLLAEDLK